MSLICLSLKVFQFLTSLQENEFKQPFLVNTINFLHMISEERRNLGDEKTVHKSFLALLALEKS